MRCSVVAIAASIIGPAAAGQHHAHQAYHNQRLEVRDAVGVPGNSSCGCSTSYTTYYGEPTLIQPAEYRAATSVQAALSSSTSTTISSSQVLTSTAPSTSPSGSTSSSQASSQSPTQSASSASSSSTLTHHPPTSSGSQWCMTYSPYNHDGTCKSAFSVSADISSIAAKGFSSIRLYSTDCSGLSSVGAAASAHNLSLVLGIYISHTGIAAAGAQISDITAWASSSNSWAAVEMVVVGNEAVFNTYCSPADLAAFITDAKTAFQKAGYSGPVTTTEPLSVLVQHAQTLCPVLDLAAANIHPFFNNAIDASSAGTFVASELAILSKICPGLDAYNLETGWPSAGQANGAAVPGEREQAVAVRGIVQAAGGRSAVFSFVDDLWKEEGDFGVERSWGAGHLFGS